ncbi:unnamed protein product [Trifolium pratense]|uniref:Uncharacterized protein n=1 Tax=Trifolium pratense TaxID=57577 RepID=A0ACB0IJQ6_TRIPR|nr:unnamed protein product [Trifolium pratense]
MEQEQYGVEKFEKFTWKVENFSEYDPEADVYSEPFVIGGYPWVIMFNQIGDDLSILLGAVRTSNMSKGWSRLVKFKLFVLNQIDSNRSVIVDAKLKWPGDEQVEFNEIDFFWGLESFLTFDDLDDPHIGFVVNDTCIIGTEVSLCKSKNEKQVNEASSLTTPPTSGSQIVQIEAEVLRPKLEESHGQNLGELMDFKGLGQIEKDLVPLLEEVCSIECQQKRSRKFREWAFTALGRVLYFLKTTKFKDLNDLACNDLQNFW